MSCSVHVYAVRNPDTRLNDMISIVQQCRKLKVSIPQEVQDYFEGTDALSMKSIEDMRKEMLEEHLNYGPTLSKISGLVEGDCGDCEVLIDLTKLPEEFTILRISLS